jgi:pyrroloquinoline quinone (PQQ) biosynthesis protein C
MITSACQRRSALEGLALLAFVEDQHGGARGVAASVYREMVGYYGFSPRAAETYHLHAEQDEGHGGRQIDAIRQFATDDELQAKIRSAVQLGAWAFNFEWDGHVQAMTGQRTHWEGVGALELRGPRVALRR